MSVRELEDEWARERTVFLLHVAVDVLEREQEMVGGGQGRRETHFNFLKPSRLWVG